MRKLVLFFVSMAVLLVFTVPAFAQEDTSDLTIADIVVASASADEAEFTVLLTAIQLADPSVLEALSDPSSSFTVFAPTDAAFAALFEALGEEATAAVLADPDFLTSVLLFHVVPFAVASADVGMVLEMFADMTVPLDTLNGQFIDVAADADGNPTINGAGLVAVDIVASNGIIHVIDAVILPESRTIAEIVIDFADAETPEFSLLLTAVLEAGLADVLSDPDVELTVFAPVDAAFLALGDETIAAVLADPDLLTAVLTYHVVAGRLDVNSIIEAQYADEAPDWFAGISENGGVLITTLQGGTIEINAGMMMDLTANDANVVLFNVDAANGIIHVIDAVLLPAE